MRPSLPLAGILAFVLAACGGGAAAPSEVTDGGGEPTTAPTASQEAGTDDGDGNDNGGSSGGDFDLCSVLSTDEVGAATGAEVADATSVAIGSGQYSCNYSTADGAPVAGTTFTTTDAPISPQEFFDANAGGGESISGVGDSAVLVGDDDFPMLFAMVGGDILGVSVLADDLDGGGKRQATIDLAELSASRLP